MLLAIILLASSSGAFHLPCGIWPNLVSVSRIQIQLPDYRWTPPQDVTNPVPVEKPQPSSDKPQQLPENPQQPSEKPPEPEDEESQIDVFRFRRGQVNPSSSDSQVSGLDVSNDDTAKDIINSSEIGSASITKDKSTPSTVHPEIEDKTSITLFQPVNKSPFQEDFLSNKSEISGNLKLTVGSRFPSGISIGKKNEKVVLNGDTSVRNNSLHSAANGAKKVSEVVRTSQDGRPDVERKSIKFVVGSGFAVGSESEKEIRTKEGSLLSKFIVDDLSGNPGGGKIHILVRPEDFAVSRVLEPTAATSTERGRQVKLHLKVSEDMPHNADKYKVDSRVEESGPPTLLVLLGQINT